MDNPTALEELPRQSGISCERVRLIEVRALANLQERIVNDPAAHRNRSIDTWPVFGAGGDSTADRAAGVRRRFSNHAEGSVLLPQAAQDRPDLCSCVDEGADHRTAETQRDRRHKLSVPSRIADMCANSRTKMIEFNGRSVASPDGSASVRCG
jgi:hypothetical protein